MKSFWVCFKGLAIVKYTDAISCLPREIKSAAFQVEPKGLQSILEQFRKQYYGAAIYGAACFGNYFSGQGLNQASQWPP